MLDLDALAARLAVFRANGVIEAQEGDSRYVLAYGIPLGTEAKPEAVELFPKTVHPLDLISNPPSLPDDPQ